MARVKIEMPENYGFTTRVMVRVSDVNYGGHMGNDAVLAFVHEARIRFLKSLGYTEIDMEGVGLIMADSAIIYKSEAFMGDVLNVDVAAGDFNKLGFDLFYRIFNKETGKDVAHVKTGMVCFDYESRKIAALPERAKEQLS